VWDYLMGLGGMSEAMLRSELTTGLRFRDALAIRTDLADNLSHLTQKAGALLAAQAIFIVVNTWGMEHGWPRLSVLPSVVLLIVSALIVLTLLRSVYMPAPKTDDAATYVFEDIMSVARILTSRAWRFNVALYMTFLSVVLLGFGAIEAALGQA
jgi:hypothetical protein